MIRDKVYWQTKQSSSWVPEQAWLASRLHTWGRRRVLGHKKTCPVFWWCYHKKWQFLVKIQAGDPRFFRPSATVSRIGVTSASLSWRTPPPAGWSPWLAGYPPHGMDGWGARPLRWLSVLVVDIGVLSRPFGPTIFPPKFTPFLETPGRPNPNIHKSRELYVNTRNCYFRLSCGDSHQETWGVLWWR